MGWGSCKKKQIFQAKIKLLQNKQIFGVALKMNRQPVIYHPRTSPSKPYRFIASNIPQTNKSLSN
jgi:hypothetical protein